MTLTQQLNASLIIMAGRERAAHEREIHLALATALDRADFDAPMRPARLAALYSAPVIRQTVTAKSLTRARRMLEALC